MLKLMPQQRFEELWSLDGTPACEEGMKLAHAFLDSCGDAVDERDEAKLDGARFAFSAAWRAYATHRSSCLKCRKR